MEAKNVPSKIDDAARKNEALAGKARAKITEVADKIDQVTIDAQGTVEAIVRKGGHRLQETAKKTVHFAEQIATKMTHSAEETAQKVVHRAAEVANKAEHRRQEIAAKGGDERRKR